MKRLLTIVLAAGCASIAGAQTEADFAGWMKATLPAMGAARKAAAAGSAADIVPNAKKLEAIFADVEKFFEKRGGAPDAVKSAADAKVAAAAAAKAAEGGDAAAAGTSLQAVGAQCKVCHAAHREQNADGTYKFK